MKVIWFSNRAFSGAPSVDSGTWLPALGEGLAASGKVELGNVSFGDGQGLERRNHGPVSQWLLPRSWLDRGGLLTGEAVAAVAALADEVRPDVVHVWGTEGPWGLLTARGFVRRPALLEIQGLKAPCAGVYSGGLTLRERAACLGLREILRPHNSIGAERDAFRRWARVEREMIQGHRHITTPSPWAASFVRSLNATAAISQADLPLRAAFYGAAPWSEPGSTDVFCSAAYPAPFKGVHDAVKALAVLRQTVPGARLRVAGAAPPVTGLKREGYATWVRRLCERLGVADAVAWLGPLTADQLVEELQRCGAMVMPSYCESYCMALAEALYLGVPCVTTTTGGPRRLAGRAPSALFYDAGDVTGCAYRLRQILEDPALAADISGAARREALPRHDLATLVGGQLARYREVGEGAGGARP